MFAELTKVLPNAIETVSGTYVDCVEPDPDTIILEDIAWSLSRQGRFVCHTLSEEVYNIAQHSIFVKDLILEALAGHTSLSQSFTDFMHLEYGVFDFTLTKNKILAHALFHDAPEAYLVDLPSPLKRHAALREPYKELERRMQRAIEIKFDLPELTEMEQRVITWADLMALQIEAANLMPSRGRGWSGNLPKCTLEDMHRLETPKHWKVCYKEFLDELRIALNKI